jgi:hypothetical protein
VENFDTTPVGTLPAGWAGWTSGTGGDGPLLVSSGRSLSGSHALTSATRSSGVAARAWFTTPQPADVQVSASVFLDTLIPDGVLVRGSGLGTGRPSYYALTVSRGLLVELVRVGNGAPTPLAQLHSATYFSQKWVRITLSAAGSTLRAQVSRVDTGQYLNAGGGWQTAPTWALTVTDAGLAGAGLAGVVRPARYAGAVTLDDFAVAPPPGPPAPVTVSLLSPAPGATVSGVVSVQAQADAGAGVSRVEFDVDGVLRATEAAAPYVWAFDSATVTNGSHTLTVRAYDANNKTASASVNVLTQNADLPVPGIPQHYPWIRIAELAFAGTPFGTFEDNLLRNSVDLVIPYSAYLAHLNAVAPSTPRLLYTNVSNLYQDLLLNWLSYADGQGLSREEAFYHASRPTPFSGNSPSSQPVNWFWGVYSGGQTLTDSTSQARGTRSGGVAFGGAGQSVYVGYPERFREINVQLTTPAGGGWSMVAEYATAVDAAGNPTAWAPLHLLADGTAGLTHPGQFTFDPPADWKPASVGGSGRLFYVRFRTVTGGVAPRAATILGRDYVGANGGTTGTIPVFDYAADLNHDGYLNDAEYAVALAHGDTARFAYEGRLFVAGYGQERFATNPSDPGFRAWAQAYLAQSLERQPLADGLIVDNSSGVLPIDATSALEPTASYAGDYGSLLNAVARRIAPHWILVNTGGGGPRAEPVVQQTQAYYEESALRPLSDNWTRFEDLAAEFARRQALRTPASYAVLDSLPTGGSPTDPRTQLATLAEYYLLADPQTTFLDFYGGYSPASSWTQHWSAAVTYDVGRPVGSWSLFASGTDPGNPALTYHVYQRQYTNALVLFKPLSYAHLVVGTLGPETATTYALGGTYRALQADGTLGPPVTDVSLRNGEGAILVKS